MGNNIKDIQQIKSLIAKGKEMGFLTFEEVNKAVPLEMNTPEQFEEIIGIFDQLEIAIVDLEKDGKKIPVTSAETDGEQSEERLELVDNEDAADFSSRSTDPVRMYLREMGAVPLLDRDGEVTIAKKIEQGEQDVLYALVEVPVAVEELINVGEDLKLNRIKLKDVVKTIEEDDPTEDEMNQRTRVILLLEEIRQTFKKKRKIYAKLDECCTLERRVTAIQKEIMAFKEEIVTRLRDIKLEKTLIDRIIETVEDYVRQMRNCQRDLSAYLLSTGKNQEEIKDLFRKLDSRDISPVLAAKELNMSVDELKAVIASLHEFNPMMGHRGCRLAVSFPEIAEMQTTAVIKAAISASKKLGTMITPHIMIPLVGEVKELKFVKDIVVETADKLIAEAGVDMKYEVGTMIEIPRAALTADEIATEADFFSFGTNDLTQMTFGFSRDDAGKFLDAYYENKIYENDPFARLDQNGVGKLIKMAAEGGRKTRPDIKLGICGEHGGDPTSVEFCHNIGLNYVSCSPFRVPIARLAAAQAAIKEKNAK